MCIHHLQLPIASSCPLCHTGGQGRATSSTGWIGQDEAWIGLSGLSHFEAQPHPIMQQFQLPEAMHLILWSQRVNHLKISWIFMKFHHSGQFRSTNFYCCSDAQSPVVQRSSGWICMARCALECSDPDQMQVESVGSCWIYWFGVGQGGNCFNLQSWVFILQSAKFFGRKKRRTHGNMLGTQWRSIFDKSCWERLGTCSVWRGHDDLVDGSRSKRSLQPRYTHITSQ